jgi:hypothetical protein
MMPLKGRDMQRPGDLLGTPASGAAIHGSFEMGCSVVALCFDQHLLTQLLPAVVMRAV